MTYCNCSHLMSLSIHLVHGQLVSAVDLHPRWVDEGASGTVPLQGQGGAEVLETELTDVYFVELSEVGGIGGGEPCGDLTATKLDLGQTILLFIRIITLEGKRQEGKNERERRRRKQSSTETCGLTDRWTDRPVALSFWPVHPGTSSGPVWE